ncbi:MAG: BCCT family transporter, partial [Desulfotignum sp.]|nr:BCCT family transporter [Desulfotignum sp.]
MDNNSKSSAKMTFWISLAVMIIFVFFGVVAPESFGNAADVVFKYMKEAWGWSFIFGASIFLVMTVFLLLSPV